MAAAKTFRQQPAREDLLLLPDGSQADFVLVPVGIAGFTGVDKAVIAHPPLSTDIERAVRGAIGDGVNVGPSTEAPTCTEVSFPQPDMQPLDHTALLERVREVLLRRGHTVRTVLPRQALRYDAVQPAEGSEGSSLFDMLVAAARADRELERRGPARS